MQGAKAPGIVRVLVSWISRTHQDNSMRLFHLLVLASFSVGLLGCGGGGSQLPTHDVKGKVTYDGADVPEGVILFNSTTKEVPSYNLLITEGSFSGKLVKGNYTVMIKATKVAPYPSGTVGANGEKEGPVQYLAAKYNESTTLSADVTGVIGTQEFDFPLKSK
jgi:hypothetical protein